MKLTKRGKENWRGKVLEYIAIDGTSFPITLAYGYTDRLEQKAAAEAHSLQLIADKNLTFSDGSLIDEKGNVYTDWTSAKAGILQIETAEAEVEERESDVEGKLAEYEKTIKELTGQSTRMAEVRSARKGGSLEKELRDYLLSKGMDPGTFEGVFQQAQEGGARTLSDIISGVNISELKSLADVKRLGLETDLTLEQLLQREQEVAQSQLQFKESQETERAAILAQLGMQDEWWQSALSDVTAAGGTYYGMKVAATVANPAAGMTLGCFDYTVPVIGKSGFIPIGELKDGDVISTTRGFKPIKKVHKYNRISDIAINGLKVTKHHPFIMADGSLKLSRDIKFGDKLWGNNKVNSVEQAEGSGTVYNLDIESHTYHVGNAILVHTGLQKS